MLTIILVIVISMIIYMFVGSKRGRKITAGFLIAFAIFILLQIFVKSTRFDLINGGSVGSRSPDREESMERGVYVADITFARGTDSIADSFFSTMETGWVERNYFGGTWYWDTNIPANIEYQFKIPGEKGRLENVFFRSPDILNGVSYLSFYEGNYYGEFKLIPASDTIHFLIVNTQQLKLDSANIIGIAKFVLSNKTVPKMYK